jgi:hypothetical protein
MLSTTLFKLEDPQGLGLLLYRPYLGEALHMGITYLATKFAPDRPLSFYFGITVPAQYFPLVLMAFEFITSARLPVLGFVGICASHWIYYREIVLQRPLKAPAIM